MAFQPWMFWSLVRLISALMSQPTASVTTLLYYSNLLPRNLNLERAIGSLTAIRSLQDPKERGWAMMAKIGMDGGTVEGALVVVVPEQKSVLAHRKEDPE
ncbi:hypothetical protein D5086_006351 [Populus alba]|uniref:Uncharacterized protein n=1 Tax=Populus alba TaxID=43335 RepID=A0ACC4CK92_POPAL